MSQLIVKAIPATVLDSSTLFAGFQAINPTGLPNSCFILKVVNASNTTVIISYNQDDDNDVVLPDSVLQLPTPINTLPNSRGAQFEQGTIVWARGVAGIGNIYLIGYYQPTGRQ